MTKDKDMFNKLQTKATLIAAQYAPHSKQVMAFAKENWRDIAVGLAVCFIIEDIDDVADHSQISATLDVMNAVNDGVI